MLQVWSVLHDEGELLMARWTFTVHSEDGSSLPCSFYGNEEELFEQINKEMDEPGVEGVTFDNFISTGMGKYIRRGDVNDDMEDENYG